jgi:hypothetical protein
MDNALFWDSKKCNCSNKEGRAAEILLQVPKVNNNTSKYPLAGLPVMQIELLA